MKKVQEQPGKKSFGRWILIGAMVVIALVICLIIVGVVVTLFTGSGISYGTGNIALIPIKGEIVSEESSGLFSSQAAASSTIIDEIEKADKDSGIKAIVLEIDSPGGEVVPSDEIAAAVKKANKTTVAWIRSTGASGAYWVASAADHIVAHRLSITGSVGVTGSYIEFAGLLERFNMTYQQLAAGKYKEVGSPYEELTSDQRGFLLKIIDAIQKDFLDNVAANRNLTPEQVKNISTAAFYLGSDAKQLGLVDELGGKDEVLAYLKAKINATPELVSYEKKKGLLDMFRAMVSQNFYAMGASFREGMLSSQSQEAQIKT
jgi:protease-4